MFENSENAFPHNMVGYICINSSQGIIKEVKLFLLGGGQKKKMDRTAGPAGAGSAVEKSPSVYMWLAQCALKTCCQSSLCS